MTKDPGSIPGSSTTTQTPSRPGWEGVCGLCGLGSGRVWGCVGVWERFRLRHAPLITLGSTARHSYGFPPPANY
ncbi:hypothetical protein CCANI_03595 [Corynebacterium canis]|nr:hypothetical protein CCANI_03595 [Corynebacterium canis]